MHASVLSEISAVGSTAKTSLATMAEPSIGALLIKMVLILGALALVAWYLRHRGSGPGLLRPFAKRARTNRPIASPPRSGLRIVSRQTLGKGAYLAVVDWEERRVLVGVTNTGISFYQTADSESAGALDAGTTSPHSIAVAHAAMSQVTVGAPNVGIPPRSSTGAIAKLPKQALIATPAMTYDEGDFVTRPSFLKAVRDLTVRR